MRRLRTWFVATAFLLPVAAAPLPAGYADPAACAACHKQIAESYRQTGMGRSFYRPRAENTIEDYTRTYSHIASNQHFRMYQRDGRYYQRRHQILPDGSETNVLEKEIHYILGSGNHSRTYLHRTPGGQLVELPLAWYPENGGQWAMNPGYDRPDHMDFRRKIDKECFHCHNSYPSADTDSESPELVLTGQIPEGIDCQRCHGPGAAHVENPRAGSIVNPARLGADRQLEVCLQCHLKSTNSRLPYAIRRFGRGYSYRPGEPLSDSILHFDRARPGDQFEITHSAYRLMKSACFVKSKGALLCTTCHDPHGASENYVRACRSCHSGPLSAGHPGSQDCVGCHMPKRRTEDVVHAVMTDHFIQRHQPARDLLAPLSEERETEATSYRGEVALLYPPTLPPTPENALYLAVAQVAEGADLANGIPRLQQAIDTHHPREAEFYFFLADAYRQTGQNGKSIQYYEEALRRKPDFLPARLNLATILSKPEAARTLEIAAKNAPRNPAVLNKLAEAYLDLGKSAEAKAALERALALDPDFAEAYENLGDLEALRHAIRLRPGSATSHNNLANLLQTAGDFTRADYHFKTSLGLNPKDAAVHFNYGRALAARGKLDQGQARFEAALRLNPDFAEAATALGMLFATQGQIEPAIQLYRRAMQSRPGLLLPRLHLGRALLSRGGRREAKQLFQSIVQADASNDEALWELGKILQSEGDPAGAAACFRKATLLRAARRPR